MIKNSGYNLRFSLLFGGHLCIIKQRFLERSIERNRNMSASVRSMTGYGRGEHIAEERKFTVEMKSVNHRYNDMTIKLPRSLAGLEDVEVKLNEALAAAYIEKLKLIEEKFGIYSENKLELAAKFPDVITVEKAQQEEEVIWEALVPALDEAVEKFVAMRTVEGENLKKDILLKGERIRTLVAEVKERSPLVVVEYQEKLNNRLKDLLGGVDVDPQRIATEVAVFADRGCVDEEVTRLESHLIQLKDILDGGGQVGRKLDFLIQEMNRESNTIASKANDIQIVKATIELKSEIEKIREQIQNLE